MKLLEQIFMWWRGQTIGTRLYTARHGHHVGEDGEGNVYYQTADGKRRWVIYNGEVDASRIPADWHGWLHHTYDEPPGPDGLPRMPWEKDHKPNLTGQPGAYRPPGSILTPATRPKVGSDYQAWSPE